MSPKTPKFGNDLDITPDAVEFAYASVSGDTEDVTVSISVSDVGETDKVSYEVTGSAGFIITTTGELTISEGTASGTVSIKRGVAAPPPGGLKVNLELNLTDADGLTVYDTLTEAECVLVTIAEE